jgi:hypothetical protein
MAIRVAGCQKPAQCGKDIGWVLVLVKFAEKYAWLCWFATCLWILFSVKIPGNL